MVHLTIKYGETVVTRLPSFKRFLEVYDLKIITQSIQLPTKIELTINTKSDSEATHISKLAYDFFGNNIIAIKNE